MLFSPQLLIPRRRLLSGGGGGGGGSGLPASIDGTAHGNAGSASSVAATLTTTNANDYIIVYVTTNGGPLTGVSGSTLGAFTLVSRLPCSPPQYLEVWAKFATGAVTSEVITATNSSVGFITIDAFGVTGTGGTSLVFDAGGPQTSNLDPISITTVNTIAMVIAGFRGNTGSPSAGSGFSTIGSTNFQLVEYKNLSSIGTTSCTLTSGAGNTNGGIVIAIPS